MDLIEELSRLAQAEEVELCLAGQRLSGSTLWRMSGSVSARLARTHRPGDAIGIVLAARPDVIACLIGAWRAGLTVASLPAAPMGASPEHWGRVLTDICAAVEATSVIAGSEERDWAVPNVGRIESSSLSHGTSSETDNSGASFIQCTSGTTSQPRGVLLTMDALAANVESILNAADLRPGESVCSVLPLSHDMGLIGMLLTGLVGLSRQESGGRITLFEPRDLRLGAGAWAQACSSCDATISAATPTMLEMTQQWLERDRSVSFSAMRLCFVGSEMIPAETLRAFQRIAQRHQFDGTALSPAYGLAEATLAVSIVRPSDHWASVSPGPVDPENATDALIASSPELVSLGRPLSGISVQVSRSERNLPELLIDGPSMFSGYVGTTQHSVLPYRTGDIGFLTDDGQVVVAGRATDFVRVKAGTVSVVPVERQIARSRYVRRSACAVLQSHLGAPLEVVFEPRRGVNLLDAARFIDFSMQAWLGEPPDRITALKRNTIEFSHSGKLRRSQLNAATSASERCPVATFTPLDF